MLLEAVEGGAVLGVQVGLQSLSVLYMESRIGFPQAVGDTWTWSLSGLKTQTHLLNCIPYSITSDDQMRPVTMVISRGVCPYYNRDCRDYSMRFYLSRARVGQALVHTAKNSNPKHIRICPSDTSSKLIHFNTK